jgi:hypothetical protein
VNLTDPYGLDGQTCPLVNPLTGETVMGICVTVTDSLGGRGVGGNLMGNPNGTVPRELAGLLGGTGGGSGCNPAPTIFENGLPPCPNAQDAPGSRQRSAPVFEITLEYNARQEQYNECLKSRATALKIADTVGFFGLGSALVNIASSVAITGYEKIQEKTATELGKAIAKQAPTPTADGILSGLQQKAIFRQGTAATLGKLSLGVSVVATAVSAGIRIDCALRSGYWWGVKQ